MYSIHKEHLVNNYITVYSIFQYKLLYTIMYIIHKNL